MATIRYRSEDGVVGYEVGDVLVDVGTGERFRAVRDGRGVALVPERRPGEELEASDPLCGWQLLLETLDQQWPKLALALREQYAETIRLLEQDPRHKDLDPSELEDFLLSLVQSVSQVLNATEESVETTQWEVDQ